MQGLVPPWGPCQAGTKAVAWPRHGKKTLTRMGDPPGFCTPEVWMKRGDKHLSCLAPGDPSLPAPALWVSFP